MWLYRNWCEVTGNCSGKKMMMRKWRAEGGGFSAEKKRLRQWYLSLTDYADRLKPGRPRKSQQSSAKE
jgi:leucyl-tRNA synthetase